MFLNLTTAFGKVNSLHAMWCAKVIVYYNRQFNIHYSQIIILVPIILKLFILVPIILKLFIC